MMRQFVPRRRRHQAKQAFNNDDDEDRQPHGARQPLALAKRAQEFAAEEKNRATESRGNEEVWQRVCYVTRKPGKKI